MKEFDISDLKIKISTNKKYKELLKKCYRYARGNKQHPSTHNAALLLNKKGEIILKGRNVFPVGVKFTKARVTGLAKHVYLNHAERDLIYKAAKKGIKTNGLIMVMPWLPCINCANAIISSGIKKLIAHKEMIINTEKQWKQELRNAVHVMNEAGVKIIAYDGLVGEKVYRNHKYWDF